MLNTQLKIEENFSKKNIASLILKQINQVCRIDRLRLGAKYVKLYLDGEDGIFFKSKNERLLCLKLMDFDEIIEAILYITFRVNETTIQHLIGEIEPLVVLTDEIELKASEGNEKLPKIYRLQIATDIVEIYDGILYDIVKQYKTPIIEPIYKMNSRVQQKIDNFKYVPPMLLEPIENEYLTFKTPKVLGGKTNNTLDSYGDEDVLEKMSTISYELDPHIIDMIHTDKIGRVSWLNDDDKECFAKTHNEDEILKMYKDSKFYFLWRRDKRGRMYSLGYNLNPQGDNYQKALLTTTKKEVLTDRGLWWLKDQIANEYGYDKKTHKWKQAWFKKAEKGLLSGKIGPPSDTRFTGLKLVNEYRKALRGEAIGFSTASGLDMTNSNIQIMALLSSCGKSGSECNLTKTGKRKSAYMKVLTEINSQGGSRTKDQVKQSLMTKYFSSIEGPKNLMEEDYELFMEIVDELLPGVEKVQKELESAWCEKRLEINFEMLDGVKVNFPIVDKVKYRVESENWRFYYICDENVGSKNYRSITGNTVHSIEAYMLRQLMDRSNYDIIGVHDKFCCHFNYYDDMFETWKDICCELNEFNMLENIIRQITGNYKYDFTKINSLTNNMIRNSEYLIC